MCLLIKVHTTSCEAVLPKKIKPESSLSKASISNYEFINLKDKGRHPQDTIGMQFAKSRFGHRTNNSICSTNKLQKREGGEPNFNLLTYFKTIKNSL